MLIIFDLDDTLVGTSEWSTPFQMKIALKAMIGAGLSISDEEGTFALLKKINEGQESFKKALLVFGEQLKIPQEILDVGVKEFYENISPDLPVKEILGARETLSFLAKEHLLALVSVGKPLQQQKKLEKAGIDSALFSRIIILDERKKGERYLALAHEFQISPSEILVCGDRIEVDLSPAKALGMTTVQMRQGRGRVHSGDPKDVDYSIENLLELQDIVQEMVVK